MGIIRVPVVIKSRLVGMRRLLVFVENRRLVRENAKPSLFVLVRETMKFVRPNFENYNLL